MKTTNTATKALVVVVTASDIAQLRVSCMRTWQRESATAGMRLSGKSRLRPLAYMLLLVLSGCTMTRSLEEMPQELKGVAALKEPMGQVAALKAPMEQVAALEPTLKAVAALDAPLKNVAELKTPLVALGAMATITQPATYVPMFGYVGIVLFLAIWGGIKMGRR